mmetsp:Transcript_12536/g.37799  ORF Transcript_12536/g.37799 Transcript_12536/m.37799 type:complete len:345 (-) Transcript_12536:346-1380(-)
MRRSTKEKKEDRWLLRVGEVKQRKKRKQTNKTGVSQSAQVARAVGNVSDGGVVAAPDTEATDLFVSAGVVFLDEAVGVAGRLLRRVDVLEASTEGARDAVRGDGEVGAEDVDEDDVVRFAILESDLFVLDHGGEGIDSHDDLGAVVVVDVELEEARVSWRGGPVAATEQVVGELHGRSLCHEVPVGADFVEAAFGRVREPGLDAEERHRAVDVFADFARGRRIGEVLAALGDGLEQVDAALESAKRLEDSVLVTGVQPESEDVSRGAARVEVLGRACLGDLRAHAVVVAVRDDFEALVEDEAAGVPEGLGDGCGHVEIGLAKQVAELLAAEGDRDAERGLDGDG